MKYTYLLIIISAIIILVTAFFMQSNRPMIPKVLMQTGKRKSDMNKHSIKWQNMNPDYDYVFFDDNDCKSFITKHFNQEVLRAFDCLRPGAFKADLFRYCWLYVEGGVYVDLDCVPIQPLSIIIDNRADFISVSERRNIPGIYQAFIACKARCPFLLKAIRRIVENCQIMYYPKLSSNDRFDDQWTSVLSITGPVLLSEVFDGMHTSGWHSISNLKVLLYKLKNDHVQTEENKKLILSKSDDYIGQNYYQMVIDRKIYNKF